MVKDIRPQKNKLRKQAFDFRRSLAADEKEALDRKIQNRLMNLWCFREEQTLLLHVAKPLEVETRGIITDAFELKKTVAVPRCVEGTRNMDFYIITSLDDLEPGAFGVMEPIRDRCEKLEDLSRGLCIMPALMFDADGHRLGYGKGYYDRFLSRFGGSCVGLCYSECIVDSLPQGKYDKQTDIVVTQRNVIVV